LNYSVADIKSPIIEELKVFEKHFKDSMKSDVALLDKISHYIIKRKGKQMRPMFVFLCAKLVIEEVFLVLTPCGRIK